MVGGLLYQSLCNRCRRNRIPRYHITSLHRLGALRGALGMILDSSRARSGGQQPYFDNSSPVCCCPRIRSVEARSVTKGEVRKAKGLGEEV